MHFPRTPRRFNGHFIYGLASAELRFESAVNAAFIDASCFCWTSARGNATRESLAVSHKRYRE